MLKTMTAALTAVAITAGLQAQKPLETLVLNDGTRLNGYIAAWDGDNYVFNAESAIYTIPADSASRAISDTKNTAVAELDGALLAFSRDAKEIFDRYILIEPRPNPRVRVADFRPTPGGLPVKVIIANDPAMDRVTFARVDTRSVTVPHADVAEIVYYPETDAPTGLVDVIKKTDGTELRGVRTGEKDGVIMLELEGGIPTGVKWDDVATIGYAPIDEEIDVASQSPWIRTYIFKQGDTTLRVRGVVKEIDYDNDLISIYPEGSFTPRSGLKLSDYTGYTAERNETRRTQPAPRLVFDNMQVYVNGKEILPLAGIRGNSFSIDEEKAADMFTAVEPADMHGKFTVSMAEKGVGQIAIIPLHFEEGRARINEASFDFAEPNTSMQIGKNGETVLTFRGYPPGKYLLLVRGPRRYYAFKVANQ